VLLFVCFLSWLFWLGCQYQCCAALYFRPAVMASGQEKDKLENCIDWKMTSNVLMGTLNPTHSLTHSLTHSSKHGRVLNHLLYWLKELSSGDFIILTISVP